MDYAISVAAEEARQKALQEGVQQGLQQAMLKVASEMKREGDSAEKIARVTGLTKEQIEKL